MGRLKVFPKVSWKRFRRNRRGDSSVVQATILSATVIAMGFVVWGFSAGWTSHSSSDTAAEAAAQVMRHEARLVVEEVHCSGGTAYIWVYNAGKVDLLITSVVIPPSSVQFSTAPDTVGIGEGRWLTASVYPAMEGVSSIESLQVYALPKPLWNPSDPSANAQYSVIVNYGTTGSG